MAQGEEEALMGQSPQSQAGMSEERVGKDRASSKSLRKWGQRQTQENWSEAIEVI